jgi:hypothetical protein
LAIGLSKNILGYIQAQMDIEKNPQVDLLSFQVGFSKISQIINLGSKLPILGRFVDTLRVVRFF